VKLSNLAAKPLKPLLAAGAVVAEQRRSGRGRSRRVGEERAAIAVGAEIEATDRVNAAEVQLRGVALAVLYCEHAGSIGNLLCRRGVDVEEINLVVDIVLGKAVDDPLEGRRRYR